MAAIILPRRWNRQPTGPVEIDFGNPLAAGTVFAWHGGAFGVAHTPSQVLAKQLGTTAAVATAHEPGLTLTNAADNQNGLYFSAPSIHTITREFTLLWLVRVVAETGSGWDTHFSVPYWNASWSNPWGALTMSQYSTFVGRLFLNWSVSAAQEYAASSENFYSIGPWHALGYSQNRSWTFSRWFRRRSTDGFYTSNGGGVASGNLDWGDRRPITLTGRSDNSLGTPMNGSLALVHILARSYTDAEAQEWTANPWQIFRPLRRRLYFPSAGVATITGDASLQEANDNLSSAATIAISATAALQEANDVLASVSAVAVTGTATIQEAADTLASDVTVAFPGATATAALGEANDTLLSAASVVLTGTAALTEANDALAATGAISIAASASLLEANDTIAAEGGTATFAIAAMTERDDALTATGTVLVTGAAAIAEASDVLASAVTVSITAAAALQEANDLLTAAGSVGTVVRTADASLQEANDALAATAVSAISASAAIIEAGDIVVSGVTVLVTANAALVEANDGLTASGTALFGVFADAALQEANDTLTSAVVQKIARRIAASDAGRWTITSTDGLN